MKSKLFQKLFLASSIGMLLLSGCSQKTDVSELKEEKVLVGKNVQVEYGETAKIDINDFFDKKESKGIKISEIELDSPLLSDYRKYSYDEKTKEVKLKNGENLPVGNYKVTLNYNNKKFDDVFLKVQDTKAPSFVRFKKEIIIEKGAKDLDLSKFFRIKDASECSMSINDENLKLDEIGEYKIKVIALDVYSNKRERECKVKIVNPECVDAKEYVPTAYLDGTTPKAHRHKWKINYEITKHEDEYEEKEVIDKDAYDVVKEIYEVKEISYCKGCGKDITDHEMEHFESQKAAGITTCNSFYRKKETVKTDTQTTHYDAVKHTEKVKVKDAYEEKVEKGEICEECGAKREREAKE